MEAATAVGATEEVAVMAADAEAEVGLVARPPAGRASRREVVATAVVMAMEVVARVAGVAVERAATVTAVVMAVAVMPLAAVMPRAAAMPLAAVTPPSPSPTL